MVRAIEIVALGISLRTVYYRARKLGLDSGPWPMRFTQAEVRRIINYKPQKSGRKRKLAIVKGETR